MSELPKDPKKIRATIRRYELALDKELKTTGFYRDGYGKRYLLGPLYLLMDDLEGALKHFAWFENTFNDDTGDMEQFLCWTLALYRSGDIEGARKKLWQTMYLNIYYVPYLWGVDVAKLDMLDPADVEPVHLNLIYMEQDILALWSEEEVDWAKATYNSPVFVSRRERYIELESLLDNEPRGLRRTELCDELFSMRDMD